MEGLLQGISCVGVLLDNILITGPTDIGNFSNLEAVLKRLSNAGLRLKTKREQFMKPSLECLGHLVDKEGLQLEAESPAPSPTYVTQLKSFSGMINFYGKFLPKLSSTLVPLHELLRKERRWKCWRQEEAFQAAKDLLQSSHLLVHYDPEKELVVSCDASPYGTGAVLAHVMEDSSNAVPRNLFACITILIYLSR